MSRLIHMTTTTTAIESLRTFALAHNELAFARMCAAALGDEQNPPEAWAGERVNVVLVEVTRTQRSYREVALNFIRSTDTTRPDGLIARTLVGP